MPLNKDVEAGQAVYSKPVLAIYDWWVLGISNRFFWQCPTDDLVDFYNRHVTGNHLDVGVGTGYFLKHCRFPDRSPRLGLMDLNPNCLDTAARRVPHQTAEKYRADVLRPLDVQTRKYDSISMNYLLHCLPGDIASKSVVFDHLRALLNPGGVIFGATLLHSAGVKNFIASRLMRLYNKKGIFSNSRDTLDGLEAALAGRFSDYSLDTRGCAALFRASV